LSPEDVREIANEEIDASIEKIPTPHLMSEIAEEVRSIITEISPTPIVLAVEKSGNHPVVFARAYGTYDVRNAIVKVETPDITGSGTIISDTEIITNYHVIAGYDEVKVSSERTSGIYAEVVGYDTLRDIALLKFSADIILGSPAEIRGFGPLVGDQVVAIGYSAIFPSVPILTFGNVTIHWQDLEKDFRQIQTDAGINPGMSGGGVFNIEGELVGLIKGVADEFVGVGFAIDVDTVASILPDLRVGYKN
jgi:S1-C subfamily serine protease